MLSLYSDASFLQPHKAAAVATIILGDDDTLKAFITNLYSGVSSSVHAELLGVCQGLEWVVEHLPDEDIRIICDNETIVYKIANYPKDKKVHNMAPVTTWLHVYNLLDRLHKPQVAHIKAHQSRYNPNSACDAVCTRLIKQVNGGEF